MDTIINWKQRIERAHLSLIELRTEMVYRSLISWARVLTGETERSFSKIASDFKNAEEIFIGALLIRLDEASRARGGKRDRLLSSENITVITADGQVLERLPEQLLLLIEANVKSAEKQLRDIAHASEQVAARLQEYENQVAAVIEQAEASGCFGPALTDFAKPLIRELDKFKQYTIEDPLGLYGSAHAAEIPGMREAKVALEVIRRAQRELAVKVDCAMGELRRLHELWDDAWSSFNVATRKFNVPKEQLQHPTHSCLNEADTLVGQIRQAHAEQRWSDVQKLLAEWKELHSARQVALNDIKKLNERAVQEQKELENVRTGWPQIRDNIPANLKESRGLQKMADQVDQELAKDPTDPQEVKRLIAGYKEAVANRM